MRSSVCDGGRLLEGGPPSLSAGGRMLLEHSVVRLRVWRCVCHPGQQGLAASHPSPKPVPERLLGHPHGRGETEPRMWWVDVLRGLTCSTVNPPNFFKGSPIIPLWCGVVYSLLQAVLNSIIWWHKKWKGPTRYIGDRSPWLHSQDCTNY